MRTPDGRYIIVRGRLWRASNPDLSNEERQALVDALMDARRAVGAAKRAGDETAEKAARADVHRAKVSLGERGPVWWDDGAPDQNRKLVHNSTYAPWWESSEHANPD
ncbi:hypothetical protein IB285_00230 [Erythrobacter sp. KMU-140]|uniref:Uncharacterized protein n=1 Tax=Erythrobacter rubeus TaxID=2760803 RepID=A0ABR8KRC8_9SPHN|nr:hypothetical protein [Erythrobacter rubeus]MBD2840676.1 hypothetical protein [Erythrobacter rubeus]